MRPDSQQTASNAPLLPRDQTAADRRASSLTLEGHLEASSVPALCERLLALVDERGAAFVTCDVEALDTCDLVAIEALARIKLAAIRIGRQLRVSGASEQLLDLISFAGLCGVLPTSRPNPLGHDA
jgi:hypothetical protein